MSKNANPGELRTRVRFVGIVRTQDEDGFYQDAEGTVLETMVKWQNAHGNEAFSDQLVSISEPATLTMRYSPLINVDQLVYKDGDPRPFEIISIDNVEERGAWTEIHVKRQVSAK